MSAPTFEELIEVKRDGGAHARRDIDRVVAGFSTGEMPDYQMAAWMMAAYLKGLNADETVWLTDAMVRSGRVVDLSSIPGVKVDKHSTGGVADTATLVIAPIVAACGVPVAKMSGRGLGHTGGTLDKLESIPGFRVELSAEDFVEQVRRIGIAVIAQTPDIDPADKKMYALRDVTATVPSIPLIVGSIISKKIAGGADAILLDVKVGSGAFMRTLDDARELASELVRVGRELGREVVCELTDMNEPLGMSVGNALEVAEAIRVLQGSSTSAALREVSCASAARLLVMGGAAADRDAARVRVAEAITSGAALAKMREWVVAQGGDPAVVDDPASLPGTALERVVRSDRSGYVAGFDASGVGRAAMLTGAGRETLEDLIDPGAGLVLKVRTGDAVAVGDPLATLYAASTERLDAAQERFMSSVAVAAEPPLPPTLFHEL
ncbi:MAG: thymidine phosphorylase [Coriobacteriia bacterium]|nr:thymidine phosphorylase [Coriobacteriia bacterium]